MLALSTVNSYDPLWCELSLHEFGYVFQFEWLLPIVREPTMFCELNQIWEKEDSCFSKGHWHGTIVKATDLPGISNRLAYLNFHVDNR